jgi:hypothetical protein
MEKKWNEEPYLLNLYTDFEIDMSLCPSIIQEKGIIYMTTLIIPKQESASNSVSIRIAVWYCFQFGFTLLYNIYLKLVSEVLSYDEINIWNLTFADWRSQWDWS